MAKNKGKGTPSGLEFIKHPVNGGVWATFPGLEDFHTSFLQEKANAKTKIEDLERENIALRADTLAIETQCDTKINDVKGELQFSKTLIKTLEYEVKTLEYEVKTLEDEVKTLKEAAVQTAAAAVQTAAAAVQTKPAAAAVQPAAATSSHQQSVQVDNQSTTYKIQELSEEPEPAAAAQPPAQPPAATVQPPVTAAVQPAPTAPQPEPSTAVQQPPAAQPEPAVQPATVQQPEPAAPVQPPAAVAQPAAVQQPASTAAEAGPSRKRSREETIEDFNSIRGFKYNIPVEDASPQLVEELIDRLEGVVRKNVIIKQDTLNKYFTGLHMLRELVDMMIDEEVIDLT
jgi:hypothetical protein